MEGKEEAGLDCVKSEGSKVKHRIRAIYYSMSDPPSHANKILSILGPGLMFSLSNLIIRYEDLFKSEQEIFMFHKL